MLKAKSIVWRKLKWWQTLTLSTINISQDISKFHLRFLCLPPNSSTRCLSHCSVAQEAASSGNISTRRRSVASSEGCGRKRASKNEKLNCNMYSWHPWTVQLFTSSSNSTDLRYYEKIFPFLRRRSSWVVFGWVWSCGWDEHVMWWYNFLFSAEFLFSHHPHTLFSNSHKKKRRAKRYSFYNKIYGLEKLNPILGFVSFLRFCCCCCLSSLSLGFVIIIAISVVRLNAPQFFL